MARISGIELPNEAQVLYALPMIYGVGPTLAKKMLADTKVKEDKRVRDLSETEIGRLQKAVEKHPVEGDLRRMVSQNIRRLEEIGSYRGSRHKKGLPSRGQRTKSNSRTKRGRRQTVGAIKKDMRTSTVAKPEASK